MKAPQSGLSPFVNTHSEPPPVAINIIENSPASDNSSIGDTTDQHTPVANVNMTPNGDINKLNTNGPPQIGSSLHQLHQDNFKIDGKRFRCNISRTIFCKKNMLIKG